MSIKQNITSLQSLLEQVNALPDAGGVELPTLTNEGIADDLVTGKELIDSEGNIVTGTNPYEKVATDTEVNTQADLIAQITTALKGKTTGGGNSEGEDEVETFDLIIQSDGATSLRGITYIEYINGEYRYHSDSKDKGWEYPLTIPNIVLKTPMEFDVIGGIVPTIDLISNINYLVPYNYTGQVNFPFYAGWMLFPLSSDNGQIVVRCFDDD